MNSVTCKKGFRRLQIKVDVRTKRTICANCSTVEVLHLRTEKVRHHACDHLWILCILALERLQCAPKRKYILAARTEAPHMWSQLDIVAAAFADQSMTSSWARLCIPANDVSYLWINYDANDHKHDLFAQHTFCLTIWISWGTFPEHHWTKFSALMTWQWLIFECTLRT